MACQCLCPRGMCFCLLLKFFFVYLGCAESSLQHTYFIQLGYSGVSLTVGHGLGSCSTWARLVGVLGGFSYCGAWARQLQHVGPSSWGTRGLLLLWGMGLVVAARGPVQLGWSSLVAQQHVGSGIKPTSPALEGGFSTTGPPGKYVYGCVSIVRRLTVFFKFPLSFLPHWLFQQHVV